MYVFRGLCIIKHVTVYEAACTPNHSSEDLETDTLKL